MSSSQTFAPVNAACFDCIKSTSASDHGTVYAPATGNQGTATTKITFIGTVELSFNFDPNAQTIVYTIVKKPGIVPESSIWSGIQDTIDGCAACK